MWALFLGLIIGGFLALIAYIFIDCIMCLDTNIAIKSIIFTALIVFGGLIGCNIERHSSSSYVEQYFIYKQTIETSLTNDRLSGFERVELVKQASKANITLASYKYDCKQWYGFNIDKRVLELEFISFE